MRKCIKISDNDAFTELKNTYGNVEYTKWVTEAGCKGINTKWKYIDITPRQLALLWAKNNVQNGAESVMCDGHLYVVAILSTAYNKLDWMSTLTTAIDSVHEEMIQ